MYRSLCLAERINKRVLCSLYDAVVVSHLLVQSFEIVVIWKNIRQTCGIKSTDVIIKIGHMSVFDNHVGSYILMWSFTMGHNV